MLAKINDRARDGCRSYRGPTAGAFAFSGGVSHVITHPATRDQRAVGAEPVRGRHVGAPILTEFPDLSVPRSLSAEKNLVPTMRTMEVRNDEGALDGRLDDWGGHDHDH